MTHLCGCQSSENQPQLIVLTGGPGAGKTAVLELAKKSLCQHVLVMPEAASVLFGGGFWRHSTIPGRLAAQSAIFHVQREMENLVQGERQAAVALCDRGTLDGLAYWPEGQGTFEQAMGIDREAELRRYAAVIHLRCPDASSGYNHQNPVRTETVEEAHRIDELILKAWAGHPNLFVVDSSPDFFAKAVKAFDLIKSQLPACCRQHQLKNAF